MAWFKVDDGFYSSRKVLSIPRTRRFSALGLWTACGAWTMKELTDGFVPREIVDELGGTESEINDLLSSKLWIEAEGGFRFWDWEDYQPSKEEIMAKRVATAKKRSEAGKKGATKRWSEDGKMAKPWQSDGKANGKRIAPSQPNPITVDKSTVAKRDGKSGNATLISDSWEPTENHIEFCKNNSLNVEREAYQFRNHAEATGRKMKNWDAAFRVWLGNAVKWNRPAQKVQSTDDWMNA